MDCKQFRKQHLAYLDDTLPGETMAALQHHVMICRSCAAHDTLVRRSLMIARNLPECEPDRDFQKRLRERLATCRSANGRYPQGDELGLAPPRHRPSKIAALVAASMVIGVVAIRGNESIRNSHNDELSMQPVATHEMSVREIPELSQMVGPNYQPRRAVPIRASSSMLLGPSPRRGASYIAPSSSFIQAMSAGHSIWPAALTAGDVMPVQLTGIQDPFDQR